MVTKVALRRYKISGGRESLYLDYYPAYRDPRTMKMVTKRSLGMYLFQNPKTEIERQYNKETLAKAEMIRFKQINTLLNEEFDFYDKDKMNSSFLDYFYSVAYTKDSNWMSVYLHFEKFTGKNNCAFKDITPALCENFKNYLLTSYQIKHPSFKMKRNSAAGYFTIFKSLLRIAFMEKMLREDISQYLDPIKVEETIKEILTYKELLKLANTPCDIPVLRSASLFSCMTGLRLGDILELSWNDIGKRPDGGSCMRIISQNGRTVEILPISEETLELCGKPGEGKVFKGFRRSMSNHPLKKWIKQAGIEKNISFNCFRHTYAVLQLSMGTDVYTLSKMMMHKNVTTTEVYLKFIDSRQSEAVDRVNLKNEN